MRGYLVQPTGEGPFPAVVVIHENRGLNPYIEDVARRAAVAGFLALAPDGLSPIGGYPGNDDDGRTMQRSLDQQKLRQDMINSAYFLKNHELCTGKLGAVGFCWGGGMVNLLAVRLGADLNAGAPFYGPAPADGRGWQHPGAAAAPLRRERQLRDLRLRLPITRPPYDRGVRRHGLHVSGRGGVCRCTAMVPPRLIMARQ